jgi:gamma-glutamylcyclotransferase (GGCT)/AIG2-like uncharacterized protein YtfP
MTEDRWRAMTDRLFAYGTLIFPEVLRAVTGRSLAPIAATLDGFRRRGVIGEIFPAIVAGAADDRVEGVVYAGLEERDWGRLDRFEGELYERRRVTLRCEGRGLLAHAYVLGPAWAHRVGAEPWDPARFARDHLATFVGRLASGREPRARED